MFILNPHALREESKIKVASKKWRVKERLQESHNSGTESLQFGLRSSQDLWGQDPREKKETMEDREYFELNFHLRFVDSWDQKLRLAEWNQKG